MHKRNLKNRENISIVNFESYTRIFLPFELKHYSTYITDRPFSNSLETIKKNFKTLQTNRLRRMRNPIK